MSLGMPDRNPAPKNPEAKNPASTSPTPNRDEDPPIDPDAPARSLVDEDDDAVEPNEPG
jgi:hypothetical protein